LETRSGSGLRILRLSIVAALVTQAIQILESQQSQAWPVWAFGEAADYSKGVWQRVEARCQRSDVSVAKASLHQPTELLK
jgi:hypothetical protein